jgi:hypothetical protein
MGHNESENGGKNETGVAICIAVFILFIIIFMSIYNTHYNKCSYNYIYDNEYLTEPLSSYMYRQYQPGYLGGNTKMRPLFTHYIDAYQDKKNNWAFE